MNPAACHSDRPAYGSRYESAKTLLAPQESWLESLGVVS
jgi:hypothetical protein